MVFIFMALHILYSISINATAIISQLCLTSAHPLMPAMPGSPNMMIKKDRIADYNEVIRDKVNIM